MAEVAVVMLFAAALMIGLGIIVFMLVDRWDAILAALAQEPIPTHRRVTFRKVAMMRPVRRSHRPGPTRQQILRAAA
jgi:hypothetical protein